MSPEQDQEAYNYSQSQIEALKKKKKEISYTGEILYIYTVPRKRLVRIEIYKKQ